MADSVSGNGNSHSCESTSSNSDEQNKRNGDINTTGHSNESQNNSLGRVEEAMAMINIMSNALQAMETRDVQEHPKTAEEYELVLESKESLTRMRKTALAELHFAQDRLKEEKETRMVAALNEIERGYQQYNRSVEDILARVIVWIEEYEHDNGMNTGVSGNQSAGAT
ncbi:hypothetical protein CORC01_00955 [Colletotrichum orchidophilum]|uniref:Uncharacterized protein n=1 Tax=Colletotrichum orchidophilum TaxID=1209926 RepID=A0A1G4BQR0_9PEZI|nr:uncharacterized protein CORC01_00955 [Colletotrichum orchidophilum]OHF03636.1 hypothetical protein CORC01_00955 [Colletotrichum orchidophilum]